MKFLSIEPSKILNNLTCQFRRRNVFQIAKFYILFRLINFIIFVGLRNFDLTVVSLRVHKMPRYNQTFLEKYSAGNIERKYVSDRTAQAAHQNQTRNP